MSETESTEGEAQYVQVDEPVDKLEEGDRVRVEYDSKYSDEPQTFGGKVTSTGGFPTNVSVDTLEETDDGEPIIYEIFRNTLQKNNRRIGSTRTVEKRVEVEDGSLREASADGGGYSIDDFSEDPEPPFVLVARDGSKVAGPFDDAARAVDARAQNMGDDPDFPIVVGEAEWREVTA